jgi:hypothetical protein
MSHSINILKAAFLIKSPKSTKTLLIRLSFFVLLGSVCVNAVCKIFVKLTPGHQMKTEVMVRIAKAMKTNHPECRHTNRQLLFLPNKVSGFPFLRIQVYSILILKLIADVVKSIISTNTFE